MYSTGSPLDLSATPAYCADKKPALHSLADRGALWVSWPKRASGVATDVTEDVVRELALPLGLVDVKVCAVDAVWSALKLVRRLPAAQGRAGRAPAGGRAPRRGG